MRGSNKIRASGDHSSFGEGRGENLNSLLEPTDGDGKCQVLNGDENEIGVIDGDEVVVNAVVIGNEIGVLR